MAIADTNKVAISLNEESTWGETPTSVTMAQTRFTGESLSYAKQTVVSETIRDDRMRDQVALVGFNTEGDVEFEFVAFDYDSWLEGALYGTWTGINTKTASTISSTATGFSDSGTGLAGFAPGSYIYVSGFANKALNRRYRVVSATASAIVTDPAPAATAAAGPAVKLSGTTVAITTATTTLTATISGNKLTFGGSTGFDPAAAGIVPGQYIALGGFSTQANNGVKRVTDVSATELTFDTAFTNETISSGTTITMTGRILRNGVVNRSYHIQKAFTDVNQFMSFTGMRVGSCSMELTANEIVTGSFSFMGKAAERATSSFASTTVPTNTSPVITASAHVGNIKQNGVAIPAGIRSLSLEIENNLRIQSQIGALAAYGIGSGFMDITGSIEVYFEDSTMFDQLINHTATELSFQMRDDRGNIYVITLPQVLFTEGYPMAGGGNDDVMLPLSYQAIRSAQYNCQIQIDLLPALV